MSYIYHLVPEPFIGTELVPLNTMGKGTDLYKSHAKKYVGREDLMGESIPKLNCKWNDVVQFSALDPQLIVNELRKHQDDLRLGRTKYFKIHVNQVSDIYDGVIFDRKSREKGSYAIDESEVVALSNNSYNELTKVPAETIKYWEKIKNEGGKFLWFPFITHILIKGKIETKDFQVCELTL